MSTAPRIYRPRHIQQRLRLPTGELYGCTDSSFAMFADAVTLGGVKITEAGVRRMSSEPIPDPQSPGLNLPQGVTVMAKLHIACSDKTGETWADVIRYLQDDRRVILQLDNYTLNDCGRSHVGHCIFLQAVRYVDGAYRILADNPACSTVKWYSPATLKAAAEKFGDQTGVPGAGIRFAISRVVPRMAVET